MGNPAWWEPVTGVTETYLCSFCNAMFAARAGSIDRTREVRCPNCARNTPASCWDDDVIEARLRGMTA